LFDTCTGGTNYCLASCNTIVYNKPFIVSQATLYIGGCFSKTYAIGNGCLC